MKRIADLRGAKKEKIMKRKIAAASIIAVMLCVFGATALSACKRQPLGEEGYFRYIYQGSDAAKAVEGRQLVWFDDFDGTQLDAEKWHQGFVPEEGKTSAPRKGGYWAEDATFVKDGNLVIRTDYRPDGELGAGWYTGAIETAEKTYGDNGIHNVSGKFSQKYGYFEIRCVLPPFIGGWAAFWLMPIDNFAQDKRSNESMIGTPDYLAPEANPALDTGVDGTEIDIFESPYFSEKGNGKNNVSHAVHYDCYEYTKSAGKGGVKVKGGNPYREFHTYGLEWTESYYKFFVDGKCTWTITDREYTKSDGTKVAQNIVSQIAEYIILSVEVVAPDGAGGTMGWCGDPELNDKKQSYDFVVDYISVFA